MDVVQQPLETGQSSFNQNKSNQMITPSFKVDQDADSITILINTPHVRAQDVDLHVQGSEFRFYLRPYFLRLHLPGNVIEDDKSKALYDPSTGQFTITISKETKGEHFPDLDLLTKLLSRKNETGEQKLPKKPLIEVIGGDEGPSNSFYQEAIDFNWELPQELAQEELHVHASYGFNNLYHGYFMHVEETPNEIIDIQSPETSTPSSRRQDRLAQEVAKFDEDHYAMDFVHDQDIQHAINYKTIFTKELRQIQKATKKEDPEINLPPSSNITAITIPEPELGSNTLSPSGQRESLVNFSTQDKTAMRNLPNKEYMLSNEKTVYLGLVDILFAYCYNHRITEGENTVESVWCIGKLCSTISCLEQFSTLREVTIACYRRAISYPLYRNVALCEKVLQDVYVLFKLGKRAILKALLDVKDMFDHHDVYYIYSKIWLDDYCIWIQHASDHVIRTLAHELHRYTVNKADLDWDLLEIEEVATQMKALGQTEQAQEH